MSFSSSRGFSPVVILAWLRSEAAEGYRPARWKELVSDPWFGADPFLRTAWAGVYPVVAA